MKQSVSRMVSNAVALFLLQAACQSAAWAGHPSYMHAISDLRAARDFIAHRDATNVMKDETNALHEIDACIHDLEHAAWYDGKNLHDHPHPDTSLDQPGRLHEGLRLLEKAHKDMEKEEDDPAAIGFRDRAIRHVDRAIGFTHRALGEKFNDEMLR